MSIQLRAHSTPSVLILRKKHKQYEQSCQRVVAPTLTDNLFHFSTKLVLTQTSTTRPVNHMNHDDTTTDDVSSSSYTSSCIAQLSRYMIFLPKDCTTYLRITPLKKAWSIFAILSMFSSKTKYLSLHDSSTTTYINNVPQGYIKYSRHHSHYHCRRKKKKNNNNIIFQLQDENQEPVVLCLPDSAAGCDPVFHSKLSLSAFVFYSRHPLNCVVGDQNAQLSAVLFNGDTFYPWVRVLVPFNTYSSQQPILQVWNKGTFQTMSCLPDRAVPANLNLSVHDYDEDNYDGNDSYDNGMAKKNNRDPMLPQEPDENNVPTSSIAHSTEATSLSNMSKRWWCGNQRSGRLCWYVTVNPGADPVMMICLTVLLGKFIS